MRAKSIFTFEINQKKIKNLNQIEIGERIRDLYYDNQNKSLYLFLETTASLGVLKIR